MNYDFPKRYRVTSQHTIMALFDKNCSHFFLHPFRVSYTRIDLEHTQGCDIAPVQLLIAVPKRNFKRAVQRNRLKRRIRELFRLHKSIVEQSLEHSPDKWAILVHYVSKKESRYSDMETPFLQLLSRIQKHVS